MQALTVLSLAAVAVCGGAQLAAYPGLLGAYPYPHLLRAAGPVPVNTVLPAPITLKTVAPAPFAVQTVATAPITVKAVAPSPVAYSVAPVAPVSPVQSQYHAQDELGQYSFGYVGGPSSRAETRDAFGVVRGSYNYVDTDGVVQTQHYVADALGFRVAGTDLPVAPDAPAAPLVAPLEPVSDTPEVKAAKAAFKAAFDEAAAAAEAAPGSRKKRSLVSPVVGGFSPLRFSYGFTAPLNYAYPGLYNPTFAGVTPYGAFPGVFAHHAALPAATTYTAAAPAALQDAELLKVVNNPGHATSYRVL